MTVISDYMGWSIDILCPNCGLYNCGGAVHVWYPNKVGNVEDGFSTEEEAVADAQSLQKSRTCNKVCQ